MLKSSYLGTVVANGLNGAAFLGVFAAPFLLGILRLLRDVRIPAIFVPLEVVGRRLPAQIAIYALVVDVVFAWNVLRIFVCDISHKKIQFCCAICGLNAGMASAFEEVFPEREEADPREELRPIPNPELHASMARTAWRPRQMALA